ncbi:MAG: heavy metal translocating P-type ATPase [Thermoplasmata archaeon]|nr:heavy metal translocating P-type ATPase [Thermoplasmata archaeon]
MAIVGLVLGASLAYVGHRPTVGNWVWLGTLVVGGLPLVYATVRRVLRGDLASDVIAALAIVGALGLDQAFAGVIIVLMQSSGEAIDSYAFQRASASLRKLLERAPRRARRRSIEGIAEIPVDQVTVGDSLVVLAGDMVPVDGLVASASALVDESAVTGEPIPRRHVLGEPVLSGTLNAGDPFEMQASRRSEDSTYSRIVELVRSAQRQKPPIQRLADRFAVWFIPLTLVLAAFGWAWSSHPVTALAVLVVATPCPLIIAVPIAVIGAVDRAADRGMVVKSGGAIEEFGRAKVVVFDKTGTLTLGRPEVREVVAFRPTFTSEGLLRSAAALEQLSSHPLAAATVREARKTGAVLPDSSGTVETPGAGIRGVVDGHQVLVGSASYIREEAGIDIERELPRSPKAARPEGWPTAFVVVDRTPAGAFLYNDPLRPGVASMVDRLRHLGVERIALLSGDSAANTQAVAEAAHISEFAGDLRPEEKLERVREFRERVGPTVMVGDGINDAAALAAASVGVAMGARGAGISVEAADIVLLVDDVTRVPDGIALGQRMVRVARQGIYVGLGASLVLMVVAVGGFVVPALGAILQEVVDVLVILNALRVR